MAEKRGYTELVQRAYDAWNEDDVEALLTTTHPEGEFHPSGVFPGMQSVYRGEAGLRRWWATFHEPWSEIKVIPERIVEQPDGAAVLIRFEGIGRDGIQTTMRFINLVEVRDGLMYRLRGLPLTEEAMREYGLE